MTKPTGNPKGRPPGFKMSEEHRTKIGKSKILSYLIEAAEGKREMSSVQAQIGLGLLKKVMPDLATVQHSGDENAPIHHRVEGIEWKIIGGSGGSSAT